MRRLQRLGASVDPIHDRAAEPQPKKHFLDLPDFGMGWKIATLALAAVIISPIVPFVLSLAGAVVLLAGGAAAGAYWLALRVVDYLL